MTFPRLAFLSLALLAVPSAFGQATLDPNKTVLTVNGQDVKAADYYRRMEFLPGVGKRVRNDLLEMPPGLIALDQIVTDMLILQLAQEKGVYPSDLEINQELQIRKAENPDLMKVWTDSGRSEAELRDQVRQDLAQFKLQTFGVTVTDQDVENHYKKNATEFTIPKQYKLSLIAVSEASDKDAVDADLKGGKTFEEVATNRSVDVSKVAKGQYGTVPVTAMNQETRKAIEAAKVGQVTEWIATSAAGQNVWVKFRVDDVIAESKEPLDARLKRRVRRMLMVDRGGTKNDVAAQMVEMRKKAKVNIASPEWAAAYKRLNDAYLANGG